MNELFDYSVPTFEEISPWLFFAPLIGFTLSILVFLGAVYLV